MITLRPLLAAEFPAYCQYFVADYSQEIVANYGHSLDVAIGLAEQDLNRYFPEGIKSPDHTLLCIETALQGISTVVGYLWHCVNECDSSTFIYDFYVAEKFRGEGVGKQAIKQLETQLRVAGIKQIKLRVAYQNQRALTLYQAVGFSISGYNLSKQITA